MGDGGGRAIRKMYSTKATGMPNTPCYSYILSSVSRMHEATGDWARRAIRHEGDLVCVQCLRCASYRRARPEGRWMRGDYRGRPQRGKRGAQGAVLCNVGTQ
jgi:hypothetical protein